VTTIPPPYPSTIWLRGHDRHDLLAAVDGATGAHQLHEKATLGERAPRRCFGFFAMLGGSFVALYRAGTDDDRVLTLQVGEARHELTDDTKADVTGPAGARVLVVKRGDEIIETHAYTVDGGPDPTAAIGEQLDFGLLIANVSTSQRRRDILLGKD
jgi:hypothetical protein